MKKLLIVEDNPMFWQAAEDFLKSVTDFEVIHAWDYEEAMTVLADDSISAVIIDCYFPRKTGSADITLGQEAINLMQTKITAEQAKVLKKADEWVKKFSERIKLTEKLEKLIRVYVMVNYLCTPKDAERSEELDLNRLFASSVRKVQADNGSEKLESYLSSFLGHDMENFENEFFGREAGLDAHYNALTQKMTESANEQPLGVLVAEKVAGMGKRFVLATSTFHHAAGTHAIHVHAVKMHWPKIVDGKDKASQKFWAEAYNIVR
jgi:CheY-like chemotaxis protein